MPTLVLKLNPLLCIAKEKLPLTLITAENVNDNSGYCKTKAPLLSSAFIRFSIRFFRVKDVYLLPFRRTPFIQSAVIGPTALPVMNCFTMGFDVPLISSGVPVSWISPLYSMAIRSEIL